MKHSRGTTMLLLHAALLMGCGKKVEEKELGDLMQHSQLKGSWETDCSEQEEGFEKKSISFTADTFRYVSSLYTDDACETLDNSITGRGTYELSSILEIPNLGDAVAINYVFEDLNWAFVETPAVAGDFAEVCNATATDGVVSILGKTCAFDATATIQFHETSYGSIAFEGEKLLVTDLNSNGGTEETRSSSLIFGTGWQRAAE